MAAPEGRVAAPATKRLPSPHIKKNHPAVWDREPLASGGGTELLPGAEEFGPPLVPSTPHWKLLVIDDDRSVRQMIREAFCDTDVQVLAAGTAAEGWNLLITQHPDVVLLDIVLPETPGLKMFEQIREYDSKLPVIFITASDCSDTAIEAMKMGAFDYLHKPLDMQRIHSLVRQGLQIRRFMHVAVGMSESGQSDKNADGETLVGCSPAMQEVYKAIGRVAPQNVTVLVQGESGTGKELVARAIYQHSTRPDGPFLAVNCAAIPESLLESELFGHERGAFTGADRQRIGKFEQCSQGTLFLDEVGDMTPLVQSKLLRVLQEQKFQRVGGNETIHTDVRIIAATNRELEKRVLEGQFRADLFYRLNGFCINLPPLRGRADDLLQLIEYFLVRFNRELGKDVEGIAPEALELLLQYRWPGNVRELQSVLKQTLLQATGSVLIIDFLPEQIRTPSTANGLRAREAMKGSDLRQFVDGRLQAKSHNLYAESLEMMERYLLAQVLRLTAGNQSRTSKILGISRGNLRKKIRSLKLSTGRNWDEGSLEREAASQPC
jgi:two-component system nitrogen regulation response regulator GlnG